MHGITCRSRNVFLRITDGKKYCYYSAYAWSCTLLLGLVAVFAHYTMDYQQESARHRSLLEDDQETIGNIWTFHPNRLFWKCFSFRVAGYYNFLCTSIVYSTGRCAVLCDYFEDIKSDAYLWQDTS